MRALGLMLLASTSLMSGEEEATVFKLSEFWEAINPDPSVETIYLRKALEPRKSANFRDLGTITIKQSPYHRFWLIGDSSTSWSSDCQINQFFQQSQIALETLDFNF